MPDQTSLDIAIGGHRQVPADWMPASPVGPFICDDPALVWLEHHGAAHGCRPDTSPYALGDFLAAKARQFEVKWLAEMAPGAVRVCTEPREGREVRKVEETLTLMRRGAPVIAQLAHTAWLEARFPDLMDGSRARAAALYLGEAGQDGP